MKALTCVQLGGPCDFSMTAETEQELSRMAWKHVMETHPEKMAEAAEASHSASPLDKNSGAENFHKMWEAAPEVRA